MHLPSKNRTNESGEYLLHEPTDSQDTEEAVVLAGCTPKGKVENLIGISTRLNRKSRDQFFTKTNASRDPNPTSTLVSKQKNQELCPANSAFDQICRDLSPSGKHRNMDLNPSRKLRNRDPSPSRKHRNRDPSPSRSLSSKIKSRDPSPSTSGESKNRDQSPSISIKSNDKDPSPSPSLKSRQKDPSPSLSRLTSISENGLHNISEYNAELYPIPENLNSKTSKAKKSFPKSLKSFITLNPRSLPSTPVRVRFGNKVSIGMGI